MADETNVTVVVPDSDGVKHVEGVVVEEGGDVTETTVETSDAVEVAQIEGETAVAIAAINADTEQARIEADLERERLWQETNAEVTALRASMTERDREIAELRERLSLAEANQSNPTPPQDLAEAAITGAVDATLSEPNLTPASTTESETAMEAGEESAAEEAAVAVAIAVPARKRRRLI